MTLTVLLEKLLEKLLLKFDINQPENFQVSIRCERAIGVRYSDLSILTDFIVMIFIPMCRSTRIVVTLPCIARAQINNQFCTSISTVCAMPKNSNSKHRKFQCLRAILPACRKGFLTLGGLVRHNHALHVKNLPLPPPGPVILDTGSTAEAEAPRPNVKLRPYERHHPVLDGLLLC